jgi:NAD(P)-dependent dehydrogenase (short-subunit alcohol dehydrogenase family)
MTKDESAPAPRWLLITGAAGDIGGACAFYAATQGWSLALTDHPAAADSLKATAARCQAAGALVRTTTFDVTDETQVRDGIARITDYTGAPLGLFNNAGYQGYFEPIQRYPLTDARKVLDVNVLGVIHVLSVVGEAMVAAGNGGAIVNMASMAGVGGAPNMPIYSASKAAVIGFTKSAAKDLAPARIRVNTVSPAFIGPGKLWERQVELQAATGSQYYASDPAIVAEQMIGSVPLRRFGSLEEVAKVVAFLLSEEASYVTGVNIEISGGSA